MTLSDLLLTVESSSADEWHKIEHETPYGWEWGDKNVDGKMYPYIEPRSNHGLAVFKKDVDITLVYGADVTKDFSEPWTEQFPDTSAHSVSVGLQYRGQLVYEWVFVVVDGGRYLLPMPERLGQDQFQLSTAKLPLARLMFALYGPGGVHSSVEDALNRGRVAIV